MTVKVKPLVWVHGAKFCGQDHSYADTELGTWGMTAYSGRGGRWAYTDPCGNDSEDDWLTRDECQAAVEAARDARILAAIEAPAQEPVAWRAKDPKHEGWWIYFPDRQADGQPLYTTPPDHLALVAAAYRDAVRNILGVTIIVAPDGISHREGAESVRRQLAGFIETLTPADALTRLSHALAAETAKREAMEAELATVRNEWYADRHGLLADRDEERKLADDLIGIVEGIDGAMNHGTWRDDHGARLKDTPQWVAFYNAARRKEQQG